MLDLPSGTVTFLFTDIEGSTALWERDSEAMATAVERHLARLRAATEADNGVPSGARTNTQLIPAFYRRDRDRW